jgi:hypothetical protein
MAIGSTTHQHGGHADKAVEARDQFRHRRHLDALGNHPANAAADGDGANDQQQAGRVQRERGAHGQRHADHAIAVARLG